MMIDPEGYYLVRLKGMTKEELEKEIRSLKREIGRLKRIAEEAGENAESVVLPSPLTRLSCSEQYLARTIEAYEEAGGIYVPTKAEQRARDFSLALERIKRLDFSIEGFLIGQETRTITVSGEKTAVEAARFCPGDPDAVPPCGSFTKEELAEGLRMIRIWEWKRKYGDPHASDGTYWELKITFEGRRAFRISGSNAYPYNFEELEELLGIRIRR